MTIHTTATGAIKRNGLPEPWEYQGYSNEMKAEEWNIIKF
jgi:hypothetical protein